MATSANIVALNPANLRLCFDEAREVRRGRAQASKALEARGLSAAADARFAEPLEVDPILTTASEREILVATAKGR